MKRKVIRERGFLNLSLEHEAVIEFPYQPKKCDRAYRMIALRKTISVERGQEALFPQVRYFFYITNDPDISPHDVVHEARLRCDQENLIQQLKTGIRALHAPVNTLNANWAFMVMASLAWSLKAWVGLSLPIAPRWRQRHEDRTRADPAHGFSNIPRRPDPHPRADPSDWTPARLSPALVEPMATRPLTVP